uniref:Lipid body protein n=1 Tax=Lobosphaera incisa TaxID=312850 RepID=A0A1X9QDS9_9CHLO|nr:lipid body protein [Lobosphaera incisa]
MTKSTSSRSARDVAFSVFEVTTAVMYGVYENTLAGVVPYFVPDRTREALFQLFCELRTNSPKDKRFLKKHLAAFVPETVTGWIAIASSALYATSVVAGSLFMLAGLASAALFSCVGIVLVTGSFAGVALAFLALGLLCAACITGVMGTATAFGYLSALTGSAAWQFVSQHVFGGASLVPDSIRDLPISRHAGKIFGSTASAHKQSDTKRASARASAQQPPSAPQPPKLQPLSQQQAFGSMQTQDEAQCTGKQPTAGQAPSEPQQAKHAKQPAPAELPQPVSSVASVKAPDGPTTPAPSDTKPAVALPTTVPQLALPTPGSRSTAVQPPSSFRISIDSAPSGDSAETGASSRAADANDAGQDAQPETDAQHAQHVKQPAPAELAKPPTTEPTAEVVSEQPKAAPKVAFADPQQAITASSASAEQLYQIKPSAVDQQPVTARHGTAATEAQQAKHAQQPAPAEPGKPPRSETPAAAAAPAAQQTQRSVPEPIDVHIIGDADAAQAGPPPGAAPATRSNASKSQELFADLADTAVVEAIDDAPHEIDASVALNSALKTGTAQAAVVEGPAPAIQASASATHSDDTGFLTGAKGVAPNYLSTPDSNSKLPAGLQTSLPASIDTQPAPFSFVVPEPATAAPHTSSAAVLTGLRSADVAPQGPHLAAHADQPAAPIFGHSAAQQPQQADTQAPASAMGFSAPSVHDNILFDLPRAGSNTPMLSDTKPPVALSALPQPTAAIPDATTTTVQPVTSFRISIDSGDSAHTGASDPLVRSESEGSEVSASGRPKRMSSKNRRKAQAAALAASAEQ